MPGVWRKNEPEPAPEPEPACGEFKFPIPIFLGSGIRSIRELRITGLFSPHGGLGLGLGRGLVFATSTPSEAYCENSEHPDHPEYPAHPGYEDVADAVDGRVVLSEENRDEIFSHHTVYGTSLYQF